MKSIPEAIQDPHSRLAFLLDPGARLDWDGRSWRAAEGTRRLSSRGGLPRIAA